ncbi:MAG: Crp/Fnr family transcriptional regulator [Acidobacteria bacterium]|nr:Crp/Fnr family transcriptional regulator [Acidobacteriota bacterium]
MPTVTDLSVFSNISLFNNLTSEQLSQLDHFFHRKTFPAGTAIITSQQPGEVIYIILSGTVKVYVEQTEGTDVTLAILAAGEVLGEIGLIDSGARSASAITLEESTLLWMDRRSFNECLGSIPKLHHNLLILLCSRLRLANERIKSLVTQDVEGRVARQMLAFAQLYGRLNNDGEVLIPLRLTQGDLANLIGATRERVNQVVAAYKHRKYISVDQNYRITIHNPEALSKRSGTPFQQLQFSSHPPVQA